MEYPAEYSGTSEETLSRLAVSKVMTLTSTYDHRIIQGAQSGDFLRIIHQLLLGEDGFYDKIFESLRIPYEPVRWIQDISASHEDDINKTARVQELIESYRTRGHLMADTDPLEYKQRRHPDLDVVSHGLTLWDLEREFATGGFGGKKLMKLRDVLGVLRDSYCRTIGIEYMHIQSPDERKWIQNRVEHGYAKPDRTEQLRILERLNAAEAFETFLQVKFMGQKRFSLEGGESAIPLLGEILADAARSGLDEVAIGMAHRGRLNVLTNIVGKEYAEVFREFEGNLDPKSMHGSGDVKYHLGASGSFTALDGSQIAVTLAANPSHLETVDPVLEGIVRAKQDIIDKASAGFTVLPLLIHGDAAFAGQGVVAETLNLSQLRGYRTGGTVHLVINNQVGFTTSPTSSRSSIYATDVARMIEAPIFHVNGDDPEACVRVAKLAFDYRQAFNKDVVIDMICYRRRGHNEGDDPSMTQPLMYNLIEAKRSVRKLYTEGLIGRGDITLEEAEEALRNYQGQLERVFAETKEVSKAPVSATFAVDVQPYPAQVETAITDQTVKVIADSQVSLPDGFTPHPKVLQPLQKRAQMITDDKIDWGMGETLAFGSLLMEGVPVRLAGQDSRRGTFVQRQHVLVDRENATEYTPLSNLSSETGQVHRLRLAAQRVRGPGLRVRLLRGPRERPGAVGGAVRRLRQRRAVGHRRVHLQRRAEVGPALRRRAAAAARLRGPGPGPLLGPPRALPADVRAEQHDRGDALEPGVVLPPPALAGAQPGAQAAGGLHAQVDAAPEGRRLAGRGLHLRPLRAGAAGRHGRPGRRAPGAAGLRQALLGAGGQARQGGHHRHRDRAGGAAAPAAGRRDRRGAGRLRPGRGPALGPGGAGQPGRVAVRGDEPAGGPGPRPDGGLAGRRLVPGGGLGQAARR